MEHATKVSLMPNLTKHDLVMKISEKTGLTQQQVFSVVQLTLEGITEGLARTLPPMAATSRSNLRAINGDQTQPDTQALRRPDGKGVSVKNVLDTGACED
jgi:hypothetical protein